MSKKENKEQPTTVREWVREIQSRSERKDHLGESISDQSPTDISEILEVDEDALDDIPPNEQAIIYLILDTGLRVSQLKRVSWEDEHASS